MTDIIQYNNSSNPLEHLKINIYIVINDYLLEKYSNHNTVSCYKRYLIRHIRSIEIEKLEDLTKIHYIDIRKSIVAFIKSFPVANTKRVVISCLRGFWEYLCDVYGYRKNPVPAKMNLPPRQSKSGTRSLEEDKLKCLLQKLQKYSRFGFCDHLKFVLVATLATTGLRISEALQINTSMIENGKLEILQKRERKRRIDLPKETQKILLEFIGKYKIQGQVFQSSKQNNISRIYAHKIVKEATGISPHGFRKSLIEILIAQGIHNHEVAKVSGHSSINMVFYYDNRETEAEAHKALASSLLN